MPGRLRSEMELPDRNERDEDAAALLLILLTRYRDELIQHLGQPPDLNRVPANFWRRVQAEMADNLSTLLFVTFVASAHIHGADAQELLSPAENAGIAWSALHARDAASGFTLSTQRMLARRSDQWFVDTLRGNAPTAADVIEDLTKILGKTRADRLASDTITSAQTAGGEWAVAATTGLSENDTWYTADDENVCPVCFPLNDTTRPEWQLTIPNGPPAHPKCRCWIKYQSLNGVPA
ncbi:MAG: hypothetical protein KDA52_07655 [Planctomycetaceae bacterium]|nr:hypothetical protein [Planctomycetaceae bacterium]